MKNNKREENKKSNKFLDFINWFREAWRVPYKKAGIKLLGYFLFFIIFFLIAALGSNFDSQFVNENVNNLTTTTVNTEAYTYKQKLLLENKHFVNYVITIGEEVYTIDGSLNKGILEGYLETKDGIKKIKLENSVLYEVGNEDIILEINLNLLFIDVNNIINKITSSRAYIEEKDNNKTYTYNIILGNENSTYKVYTNEINIYKIEIFNDIYNYSLNFDI